MRSLLILPVSILGLAAGGCAVVGPQSEPSWTDARIAEQRDRPAPHYVPELERPVVQSWTMASNARTLADTRDLVISAQTLLELPRPDALEFGRQARERATPPPLPVRD